MAGTEVRHTPAGHRQLPHTADLILEAWAPTREECIAEAVQALVECVADVGSATVTRTLPVRFGPSADEALLVDVLEEVLYILEIFGVVPVATHLEPAEDGGVSGVFDAADLDRVDLVGSVPKAVTLHELEFAPHDGWRALVIVDV